MMLQLPVGLDFGNKNVVIAIPRKGSIDIVQNASSERLTPTLITYSDRQRFAGDFALHQQMNNVSNTISQIKRLAGLRYSDPEREIVQNLVPFPLVELPDGFTGVRVSLCNEEKVFRPEQFIAYLFRFVLSLLQKVDTLVSSLVIAVSPWWNEVHRRVILDAAKIACIEDVTLVNSTTAAAVTYVINHSKKLPDSSNDPIDVVFIDFGDSSVNVAVAKLNSEKVVISSFACDEHLGGSHFTEALLQYILNIIKDKYKLDPTSNERAMLRLRKATEDAKKKLSVNSVVPFEVHSFMNDIDISFPLKRTDFEDQIGDLLERIAAPVERALELAHVTKEQLSAIEVLGGASRVVAVKNRITEIFGKDPTQSLNLDECFATGSGYMAAVLCPSVRVTLDIKDVAPHEVKAEWTDDDNVPKESVVFPQFAEVPSFKRIPIIMKKSCTVHLFSDDCDIGDAKVEIEEQENPVKVVLRMQLTQSSTINVIEAIYHIEEEEKKGNLTFIPHIGLSDEQIKKLINEENEFHRKDLAEIQIDDAKNELESCIFQTESAVERDYPECFDPEKTEEFKSLVQQIHDWFSEHEFDRLPLHDYISRLNQIKLTHKKAYDLHQIYAKIADVEESIRTRANKIIETITEHERDLAKNPINELKDQVEQFLQDYGTKIEEIRQTPHHIEPNINISEYETFVQTFENRLNEIIQQAQKESKKWCNVM